MLLSVALSAGNYLMFARAPFGPCTIGALGADVGEPTTRFVPYRASPYQRAFVSEVNPLLVGCPNYIYYFVGAPLLIGLLLLLILPNLVTREETTQEAKPAPAQPESRKAAPPPPQPKPTTDAAVQLQIGRAS